MTGAAAPPPHGKECIPMSQPYDFTILTDSSADLGEDLVREMDIQVLPLSFTI